MMKVERFIKYQILKIKKEIGDQKAVVACSGGVDSVTCTILGQKALDNSLVAVFIDDGLMREGEPKEVVELLRKFGVKTKLIRAQRRFFQALKGKIDPEKKRKAFREVFYQVLGEKLKKEKAKFLIQGTIKADVIETKRKIKTQHNVLEQIGIDPKKYGLSILEPLKDLFKPDVRKVAKALGLPKEVWNRMPFPGPGLATRIVGEVTPDRAKIVRKAHALIEKELERFSPFQVFAVLLTDKATGVTKEGVVKGDRVFGNIIIIRSVDSRDAVTAKVTKIPWKALQRLQKRITTEIPSATRVLFDLTPKPPATIEYV